MSTRLILWLLVAWPIPALAAGALGWKGIWGSGSALTDFLIPIPVAGGALHVPSFVLGALAVELAPNLAPAGASRLRGALLGVAAAGALWLVNLEAILLALQTGAALPYRIWQENPLGLFLASDALLALAFTLVSPQRPVLRLDLATVALALLPATLPLAMALPRSAGEEPFRIGERRYGEQRGDESIMVFTRLATDAPGFRERAEAWIARDSHVVDPRRHVDTEDVATHFTVNLDAARRFDRTQAALTLCLYEDGTPGKWLPGAGDCFGEHLNFAERLDRAVAARPKDEPHELRHYLGARDACTREKPPPDPPGPGTELSSIRFCNSLPGRRDELLRRFPDEPRLLDPAR